MARLMEDSCGDELGGEAREVKGNGEGKNMGRRKAGERGECMEKMVEGELKGKSRPRKRVLGQKVDNPLLRPISGREVVDLTEGVERSRERSGRGRLVKREIKKEEKGEDERVSIGEAEEGILEMPLKKSSKPRREGTLKENETRKDLKKKAPDTSKDPFDSNDDSEEEKMGKPPKKTINGRTGSNLKRKTSKKHPEKRQAEHSIEISQDDSETEVSRDTQRRRGNPKNKPGEKEPKKERLNHSIEFSDDESGEESPKDARRRRHNLKDKLNEEEPKKVESNRCIEFSHDDSEEELPKEVRRRVSNVQRGTRTTGKIHVNPPSSPEFEKGDFDNDSDGLSDFIVNDTSILEDSVAEITPPKSTRKLFRGRKPRPDPSSESDALEEQMKNLKVEDDPFTTCRQKTSLQKFADSLGDLDELPKLSPTKKIPSKPRFEENKPLKTNPPKQMFPSAASPDIEDPFTLQYSPSESKPKKIPKETRFATPPGSPKLKPRGLISPKKAPPRIPSTPHQPNMDSFWQQDVVNDWNDEYSPRKTPKPRSLPPLDDSNDLSEGALLFSPTKKSSPVKPDRSAKVAKKAFSERKNALAESFLQELDQTITKGQISNLSSSTGGVKIIWSKKLNTTAGRANWRRETIRPSPLNGVPIPAIQRHHAAIELAEKVIDNEDRLLNVIAHEFCHLANFMVSNIKNNPHGKEFKEWAKLCGRHFGERGIEVTTKHSYQIDYKYVWECVNCGLEFKRHSKSIDPLRHQCGSCKSKLVQVKPVPRKEKEDGKKGGGMGEYQLFVKENMKKIRQENPGSPQKEIMGLVGKKYQEQKAAKGMVKGIEIVKIKGIGGSKEATPDDDGIADVARKLVFLDLTSP